MFMNGKYKQKKCEKDGGRKEGKRERREERKK